VLDCLPHCPTACATRRDSKSFSPWCAGVLPQTYRWALLGNAVSVEVARWLGERLAAPHARKYLRSPSERRMLPAPPPGAWAAACCPALAAPAGAGMPLWCGWTAAVSAVRLTCVCGWMLAVALRCRQGPSPAGRDASVLEVKAGICVRRCMQCRRTWAPGTRARMPATMRACLKRSTTSTLASPKVRCRGQLHAVPPRGVATPFQAALVHVHRACAEQCGRGGQPSKGCGSS
jgi:hypothetical protein